MTDQPNQVTEHYKEMLDQGRQQPVATNAQSETQKQLQEMDPGARSALEFAERVYQSGGNEGPSYTDLAGEQGQG